MPKRQAFLFSDSINNAFLFADHQQRGKGWGSGKGYNPPQPGRVSDQTPLPRQAAGPAEFDFNRPPEAVKERGK